MVKINRLRKTTKPSVNHRGGRYLEARFEEHIAGEFVRQRCRCNNGYLPITYEKDWDMTLLFDDRARQVERDTGRVFCRHSRENRIAQETRSAPRGNTSQETRVKR